MELSTVCIFILHSTWNHLFCFQQYERSELAGSCSACLGTDLGGTYKDVDGRVTLINGEQIECVTREDGYISGTQIVCVTSKFDVSYGEVWFNVTLNGFSADSEDSFTFRPSVWRICDVSERQEPEHWECEHTSHFGVWYQHCVSFSQYSMHEFTCHNLCCVSSTVVSWNHYWVHFKGIWGGHDGLWGHARCSVSVCNV